jgi:hypothetical protein
MNIKTESIYKSYQKCQACGLGRGTYRFMKSNGEAQALKVRVAEFA